MTRPAGLVNRSYTPAQRVEAVALAATIGPLRAGRELGIPPRTVASWMHKPEASVVIRQAEATIAERLKAAHEQALTKVMEGLNDPHQRLGDRVRALEVLGEQRALAEGRATANIATSVTAADRYALMEPEQVQAEWDREQDAASFIATLERLSDDELAAWMQSPAGMSNLTAIAAAAREQKETRQ